MTNITLQKKTDQLSIKKADSWMKKESREQKLKNLDESQFILKHHHKTFLYQRTFIMWVKTEHYLRKRKLSTNNSSYILSTIIKKV